MAVFYIILFFWLLFFLVVESWHLILLPPSSSFPLSSFSSTSSASSLPSLRPPNSSSAPALLLFIYSCFFFSNYSVNLQIKNGNLLCSQISPLKPSEQSHDGSLSLITHVPPFPQKQKSQAPIKKQTNITNIHTQINSKSIIVF